MEKNRGKLWFKAHRYGYGWHPCSWEGWLVILIYVAVVVGSFIAIDSGSHSVSDTLINFVPDTVAFTILLLLICYLRGEKPRWRWGDKK